MQKKIQIFMEQHHMIESGDRVIAGVSGGADSVCLLLILCEMSRRMGFFLAAVHVEHGIRGEESRRDAAFTERLCADLEVPFLLCPADAPEWARTTGQGLEEAARELRYNSFFSACETFRADKIALAHHANDSAETMLFHLARGTGIRGMCGIRPVTEMSSVRVIRPLLCVTREEILGWLGTRGQDYCTDSTNGDISYTRNRIRGLVLPELEEVNPQAVTHMQRTAAQLQEICDYLDEAAWQAGEGTWEIASPDGDRRSICIFEERFTGIPPFLQKHLTHLLLGMESGSRKDITSLHVERVLALMGEGVGKKVSLPGRVTAERTYSGIQLRRGEQDLSDEEDCAGAMVLQIPGETYGAEGLRIRAEILNFTENSKKIPKKRYTKWFDYDKIKFVVQLRGRRTGDYLQVSAAGGHKKLTRYLIDEKIPLRERDRLRLLADGDHIMWVIGYRISEAYKVTEETKHVLCVQVDGARG
ncbi:MAG: tRNA lysidine(34) synthetase TilS [Clostridiales bacterium]|nr:tRNA lysidine(34) synthetase TilS [Clostridiales bacterium]